MSSMPRHRLVTGCREDDRMVRPFAQGFLVATGAVSAALLPLAVYVVVAVLMERAR